MPQKMILAWEKKVRLTHPHFKKKGLLEHLQKNKYNASYPIQQFISIIQEKHDIKYWNVK